ncbi:hypothetical protein AYO20_08008 [Fonsecaea nubica]|uniref:1-alkyl-2-acetylglycerophosphocholine esterase n=1 Tax=Fonsecaea nubica TaxID=856822 RepID=A0A178CQE0_9EURO|nr:hypothetical protein AYO20_08008 [Fonsecaea nubica]OAL32070.1 hypothetical protein AYO20_08008 [Fonsecaea nubica]
MSRVNPFAPCCNKPRRLMLTLYPPNTCQQTEYITYVPPTSAAALTDLFGRCLPNLSFDNLQLTSVPGAAREQHCTASILLSPPPDPSYDHLHDGTIVEYPDDSYVENVNVTSPDKILTLLEPRIADVSFVLDNVTNGTLCEQLGIPSLDTDRTATFGHSLGGATAVDALLAEPRLRVGCNRDGGLWGDGITLINIRLYLLLTAGNHPAWNTSLAENWPYQTGRK